MKKTILILFLLWGYWQFGHAKWKQEEFMIGTHLDANVSETNASSSNYGNYSERHLNKDTTKFRLIKKAYFNTLSGFSVPTYSPLKNNQYYNLYLAGLVGLKSLVSEGRFMFSRGNFVGSDQSTNGVLNGVSVIDDYKNNIDALRRGAILGYNIGDEPDLRNALAYEPGQTTLNAIKAEKRAKMFKWIEYFNQNDPDKMIYLNICSVGNSDSIGVWVNNQNNPLRRPSVISYDTYPLCSQNQEGMFYRTREWYFNDLNNFACYSKNNEVNFWAYVLSTHSLVRDGNGDLAAYYVNPNKEHLRFMAFCPIAYGAKGLNYFSWQHVNNFPNDYWSAIEDPAPAGALLDAKLNKKYDHVKEINHYIAKILGPLAMKLKWIKSYHKEHFVPDYNGQHTDYPQNVDPNSLWLSITGQSIDRCQSEEPLIKDFSPELLAGRFEDPTNSNLNYLMIVNKKFDPTTKVSVDNLSIITDNLSIALKGDFRNRIHMLTSCNNYNGEPAVYNYVSVTYNQATNLTTVPLGMFTGGEIKTLRVRKSGSDISGTITTNQTWTPDKEYYIIGNTTIPANVTLNIQAGVKVHFENNAQLTVNGTLKAQGTSTNKVVFDNGNPVQKSCIVFTTQNNTTQINNYELKNGCEINLKPAFRTTNFKINN